MKSFFEMVEDFGNMSTGAFIAKYPDCGHYEGYGYVQRKAREARRKETPQPVDETERLREALEDTMSTLSAVKAEAIVDGGGTCLWIAEKLNQQMIDNRAALDADRPQHKGEVSRG